MKEPSVQELALHLVRPLVKNPDVVGVREAEGRQGAELRLSLDPSDIGRVIGRQGRTISALRNIVDVASRQAGEPVRLEIEEPED